MSLTQALATSLSGLTATQTNCKNNKPPTNTIGWTATSSPFATGYRVERGTTNGGPYSLVANVAIGTTSYLDVDPTLGFTTTLPSVAAEKRTLNGSPFGRGLVAMSPIIQNLQCV